MTITEKTLQVMYYELVLKELPEKERQIVLAMEEKIKEIISVSPVEGIVAIGHIGVLLTSENPEYIRKVFGEKWKES